jgi:hypothetical protein
MNPLLSTIDKLLARLPVRPIVVASGCAVLFLMGVVTHIVAAVFLVTIPIEIVMVSVGAAILALGLLRRPSRNAALLGFVLLSTTIGAQIYPWPSASVSAKAAYWIQFSYFKSQLDGLQKSQREAGTYNGATFIEVEGWNALSSGFAVIDTSKTNAQALIASHRGIGGTENEAISNDCDVEWYQLRKGYFHWDSACER